MEKILIALDYNPSAQKVAEYGHQLAKTMKANALLLHVVADYTYYSSLNYSPIMGFEGFTNAIEVDTDKELERAAGNYLDRTTRHLNDITIQIIVKSGDFAETILKSAKDLDVSVIVMGTHSRKGLEKLLLGSVTEHVLRHSTIPVFIIPTRDIDGV